MQCACGQPVLCKGMCNNCYKRDYYKDNRETILAMHQTRRPQTKNNRLLRLYGISLADWQEMYEAQQGLCKICKTEAKLFVDHNHEPPNQVRGLLCDDCNKGLGNFKDNPAWLIEAAKYLVEAEEGD